MNPRMEIRSPKTEIRRKSEARNSKGPVGERPEPFVYES
jgi:hypothetical protein